MLSIKTDKAIKREAQEAAEELGFPLGTIINAFLRQFARDKEISFSVPYKPTKYLERIIGEAEREWNAGKVPGPFTFDELKEHLR
ncbi:MAG: hypothetical protein UY62_C0023G0011 [Parcubacteria group bacterium GW2011_GWF2_50_9]|nr:MAG: hypothetical protein UY62_C0023G0011 [Parcubacteria group bacterium GW2011_GWF2_50_9]